MTNISRKRQLDYIRILIKNHLVTYKWLYISMLITLIVGIVIGIITICNVGISFEIDDLRDKVLLDYLKGGNTWIGFLLLKLLEGLILLFVIWLCSLKKWLMIGDFILLLYNGYFIGVNCTIIILSLGFIGVLYTLFIIAPCYIFTNILYICLSIEKVNDLGDKCFNGCKRNKNYFIKKVILFSSLLLIIKIIEMLLISIFITRFLIIA